MIFPFVARLKDSWRLVSRVQTRISRSAFIALLITVSLFGYWIVWKGLSFNEIGNLKDYSDYFLPNLNLDVATKPEQETDTHLFKHYDFVDFASLSGFNSSLLSFDHKYFTESTISAHIASGYASDNLVNTLVKEDFVRVSVLRHIFTVFTRFANEHDMEFWLAHGTLIGYWWGRKVMPYDEDMDLQTSFLCLYRLAGFNQTILDGRFLIDVNPHFTVRRKSSEHWSDQRLRSNLIDARCVDMKTGLYIDITALSIFDDVDHSSNHSSLKVVKDKIHDKGTWNYNLTYISPLQRCIFEDVETWCPAGIENILDMEFKDWRKDHYRSWKYEPDQQVWVRSS